MPAYEFNISFLGLTNYFGGKQEGLMENINVSVSPSCMCMSIATCHFLCDLQSHIYIIMYMLLYDYCHMSSVSAAPITRFFLSYLLVRLFLVHE